MVSTCENVSAMIYENSRVSPFIYKVFYIMFH